MISLLPVHSEDLPTIAALVNRAFGTSKDAGWVESHCARHRVALEDSALAQLDGEAVGYVLVGYPSEPGAQVTHIGVVPEARRRGAARTLLEHAALAARRREHAWLWLETEEENAAAVACYHALGFEVALREPTWQVTMPAEPPLAFLDDVVFRPMEDPLGMYDWYDGLPLSFDHETFEQYRYTPGRPEAFRATRHGETIAAAYVTHTPDGRCRVARLRFAEMADWIPEFLRATTAPGQSITITDATGRYGQWLASWGYTPGPVTLWMRRHLTSE